MYKKQCLYKCYFITGKFQLVGYSAKCCGIINRYLSVVDDCVVVGHF